MPLTHLNLVWDRSENLKVGLWPKEVSSRHVNTMYYSLNLSDFSSRRWFSSSLLGDKGEVAMNAGF